jgi:hypothetical protein
VTEAVSLLRFKDRSVTVIAGTIYEVLATALSRDRDDPAGLTRVTTTPPTATGSKPSSPSRSPSVRAAAKRSDFGGPCWRPVLGLMTLVPALISCGQARSRRAGSRGRTGG